MSAVFGFETVFEFSHIVVILRYIINGEWSTNNSRYEISYLIADRPNYSYET